MGSFEPRALHASRLLKSAHARPKEIYLLKGDLCPVMGSLEPQAREHAHWSLFFFFFGCGSLRLPSGGYRLIFSGSASPPKIDHWKRNCPLKGPLEPQAPSARLLLESTREQPSGPRGSELVGASGTLGALAPREFVCVPHKKPSRLRLFSPLPKKLLAPQAQDKAGFKNVSAPQALGAIRLLKSLYAHFLQEGFTGYWTSSPSRRGSLHKFQWGYHSLKETTFSRLLQFGHLTSRESFGLCRENGSITPSGVAASGGSTRPSQLRQEGCRRTKWNPIGPTLT